MIPILTYHSIDNSGSIISVSSQQFRKQMLFLRDSGYITLTMEEAVIKLAEGYDKDKKYIAITFDDGFRTVYTKAFPILAEFGLTATVFIVTDMCRKTNYWDNGNAAIPVQKLLGWEEISEMSEAGIEFGAHTKTHKKLSALTDSEAQREIVESKEALERELKTPVTSFAYPYGDYTEEIKYEVAKHFSSSCSTYFGFASETNDLYALPRIDMFYFSNNNMFYSLDKPFGKVYVRGRSFLRELKIYWNRNVLYRSKG